MLNKQGKFDVKNPFAT